MSFIRAGGFNMFILLALAVVIVPTAILFAKSANPHRLSILRALSWALLAATLTGFVAGLAATCRHVVNDPEMMQEPLPYLLLGFAESTANLVLGGGIAVITWILVAVGVRRMPHDNS
jgi:hypothetical protein